MSVERTPGVPRPKPPLKPDTILDGLEMACWNGQPYRLSSDSGRWDTGDSVFVYDANGTLVLVVSRSEQDRAAGLVALLNAAPALLVLARATLPGHRQSGGPSCCWRDCLVCAAQASLEAEASSS